MLDELAIIAVRGIGLGSIYALVAMSFNIVTVSSGVLNFAQGNMVVLGGVLAYVLSGILSDWLSGPGIAAWFLGLPLAALGVAVVMTLQGWLTLWPMRDGDDDHDHSWLITTMAVSVIMGAAMMLFQGPNALTVRSAFPAFTLLGMRVPAPFALATGLALLCYMSLQLFLSKTLTGLALSALWQNPDAARAAGLRVRRLQLLAFAISGLIVGAAGFVAAPLISISPDAGFRYVLNGFVALVVGGMGSNLGALIAGPLVGCVAMFATYRFGAEFQGVVSLTLLVGMLLARPQGMFGRTRARRV